MLFVVRRGTPPVRAIRPWLPANAPVVTKDAQWQGYAFDIAK